MSLMNRWNSSRKGVLEQWLWRGVGLTMMQRWLRRAPTLWRQHWRSEWGDELRQLPQERALSTMGGVEVAKEAETGKSWDDAASRRFLDTLVAEVELPGEENPSLGSRESLAARWRRVTNRMVIEKGGRSLLRQHGNSLYAALVCAYPEQRWAAHEVCRKVPKGHWDVWEHRRAFMDSLKKRYGILQTLFEARAYACGRCD